jgi:polysaccharide deacetylase 2 family uncharacterized protein YibQ/vacuolar-type H+-ATPase subunit F/Vma7
MARKGSNKKLWILAGMLLLIAVVYLALPKEKDKSVSRQYELKKTGAGAVADFTATCGKIHDAVDQVLKENGVNIVQVRELTKEVPRQKVEGVIRWHSRKLAVHIPQNLSAEALREKLADAVKAEGGAVLGIASDNYQGTAAERIDVGIKDKLAGDDVTIISDSVYVLQDQAKKAEKAKTVVKTRGEMAIIIDDFGYSQEPIAAFANISAPLTFSVLPYHTYSAEAASRGISSGHQVILHLPMEPLNAKLESESKTITVAMSDEAIKKMTLNAINAIPGAIGVNNHQGSRATADKRVMRDVLQVIKDKGMFFVDSRTNSRSVAVDVARQSGVPTAENDLFIDNASDVAAVERQLRVAERIALRSGEVVVIGHARVNTADALREMIPELESSGVKLVFVSQLVR